MATLPKKLFAQVSDFAKMKGVRMNPEQTEAALKKLKESSFSVSGWEKRDNYIDVLKKSGLLTDPDVERVYAVGSATTSKADPKDLDILMRGRTGKNTEHAYDSSFQKLIDLEAKRPINKGLEDDELAESILKNQQVHLNYPKTRDYKFKNETPYTQTEHSEHAKIVAEDFAKVGAKRYGDDHKWIRLVGIPAAVSLGLMTEEEAEAAFKPVEIAKATAKLLKQNVQTINPGGFLELPSRDAKRLAGVTESMLKIPQKEYSRITGVHVQPEIVIPGHASTKGVYVPQNAIPWRPSTSNKVFLSAMKVDKLTFPHEIAHGRQYNRPGTIRFLDDLQQHVKKWIKDPWEQYWSDPKEVHARGVAEAVGQVEGPLTQSIYDEIYNNELHKAIQYTEKWLQHLDPTFKARFLKNIAIGGAVMTALSLGPDDEAEAMPRGVYQAIDYGQQLWRKTRDVSKLIGRTLAPGKVIDDVVVTGENERRIRFTDGTESIIDKKDLAQLYRSLGTRDYEAINAIDKDPVSQMTRALKSLSFHEARYKQVPENQALQYVDDYLRNLSEMGQHISPDLVFVQRGDKVFTMPRAYAELLEEQDLLKILRSDKYIELLEKYKVK